MKPIKPLRACKSCAAVCSVPCYLVVQLIVLLFFCTLFLLYCTISGANRMTIVKYFHGKFLGNLGYMIYRSVPFSMTLNDRQ